MSDIILTTDFTQLTAMNNEIKSTDGLFVKVVDSILREVNRANRVTKALAKTTEENLKIVEMAEAIVAAKVEDAATRREKARQREAERAERDAERKRKAIEKEAAAEAKLAQEIERNRAASAARFTSGLNERLGITGTSAMGSGASFSAMEAEVERLRQKYDQVYSSSRLYQNLLDEINQAHLLGAINAKQHESAIESLNAEYQAFQNGTATVYNRFAQGVEQTGSGLNNTGVLIQQLGYQAGDFAVQVQSGTNAFVAFGQQATQLVGFLPMLAAELNIAKVAFMGMSIPIAPLMLGLSILVPTLTAIGAYFSRTASEADAASEALKQYEQVLESLNSKLQETSVRLEAMRRGLTADNFFEATLAIEDLQKQFDTLMSTEVSGFWDALTRGDRMAALTALRLELETQLETLRQQAAEEERVTAAARLRANEFRDSVREEFLERQRVTDAHAESVEQMGKALNNQRLMTIAAEDALSKYSMMRSVAAGIANEMARAAANTQAAANAALTAMRTEFSPAGGAMSRFGGRGTVSDRPITDQYGDVITLPGSNRPQRRPTDIDFGVSNVSGGGGSRAETRLKKQIELTKELTQAEKDRQTIVRSIEGSLESGFMAMVEGTKSVKDAFKQMAYEIIKELYRVLVVQRLVGGISSAVGMFTGRSTGSFGLPFGLATGGSMMPNRPYLVGEHGPELVIPRHSGTVVNANQTSGAMSGGGGITVQNNITVTGSDAAMVRQEVAKMIPQITNATKAAVIDARLRGGQMKAAFS